MAMVSSSGALGRVFLSLFAWRYSYIMHSLVYWVIIASQTSQSAELRRIGRDMVSGFRWMILVLFRYGLVHWLVQFDSIRLIFIWFDLLWGRVLFLLPITHYSVLVFSRLLLLVWAVRFDSSLFRPSTGLFAFVSINRFGSIYLTVLLRENQTCYHVER